MRCFFSVFEHDILFELLLGMCELRHLDSPSALVYPGNDPAELRAG